MGVEKTAVCYPKLQVITPFVTEGVITLLTLSSGCFFKINCKMCKNCKMCG